MFLFAGINLINSFVGFTSILQQSFRYMYLYIAKALPEHSQSIAITKPEQSRKAIAQRQHSYNIILVSALPLQTHFITILQPQRSLSTAIAGYIVQPLQSHSTAIAYSYHNLGILLYYIIIIIHSKANAQPYDSLRIALA